MGLDIDISRKKAVICPHCGKITEYKVCDSEESGGRAWYPFLESIGYYVPWEQRTEENDWYCKDMTLSTEQAQELYQFLIKTDVYNGHRIQNMVARALLENEPIVVNANW